MLADFTGHWFDRGAQPPNGIVLDMDASVSPTYGDQEGTAFNYVIVQMAEVAVPRELFQKILRLIDGLRQRRDWSNASSRWEECS